MLVSIATIIIGLDIAVHSNVSGREFGMIVAFFLCWGIKSPYFLATLFSQILVRETHELSCHPLILLKKSREGESINITSVTNSAPEDTHTGNVVSLSSKPTLPDIMIPRQEETGITKYRQKVE